MKNQDGLVYSNNKPTVETVSVVGTITKKEVETMNPLERLETIIEGANAMKSDIALFGEEQKKLGYDQGWTEAMAQAGTGGTTDKIYSENEMNQILSDAIAPLNAKVSELQNKIDAMPVVDVEAEKLAARKAAIAEVVSEIEAQQSAESASEQSLLDSLKSKLS